MKINNEELDQSSKLSDLEQELKEGYIANAEEALRLCREFEPAVLEVLSRQ